MNIHEEIKQVSKTELNEYINNFIDLKDDDFIKFYNFRHHYTFIDKNSVYQFTGFLDIISNLFNLFPFSVVSLLDSFCFINVSSQLSDIFTKDFIINFLSSPLSINYSVRNLNDNTYLIKDSDCPLLYLFDLSNNETKKYIVSYISDNISIDTICPEYYKDSVIKVKTYMNNAFLKLLKEYMEVYDYTYSVIKE